MGCKRFTLANDDGAPGDLGKAALLAHEVGPVRAHVDRHHGLWVWCRLSE